MYKYFLWETHLRAMSYGRDHKCYLPHATGDYAPSWPQPASLVLNFIHLEGWKTELTDRTPVVTIWPAFNVLTKTNILTI